MSHGIITLTQGKVAIIDSDMVHELRKYSWRAVKYKRSWYAKTTIKHYGRQVDIGMHRLIAQTPKGMICHHKNHDSLDNRRENLGNMEKQGHTLYHAMNKILIKYSENYSMKDSFAPLPAL